MKLTGNKQTVLEGCVSERIKESRVARKTYNEAKRALDSMLGAHSGWGTI